MDLLPRAMLGKGMGKDSTRDLIVDSEALKKGKNKGSDTLVKEADKLVRGKAPSTRRLIADSQKLLARDEDQPKGSPWLAIILIMLFMAGGAVAAWFFLG